MFSYLLSYNFSFLHFFYHTTHTHTHILFVFWTFDPAKKCHSKVMHRKEVTHSNGSYERKSRGRKLADEMGRGKKFPWYTHRLMHRKRVTCEPAWQLFPLDDDQTCDSKDRVGDRVDVELLYNSVKTEVRELEIGRSYRRDVVGKATPGRRGSGLPIELGSREVADKMQ